MQHNTDNDSYTTINTYKPTTINEYKYNDMKIRIIELNIFYHPCTNDMSFIAVKDTNNNIYTNRDDISGSPYNSFHHVLINTISKSTGYGLEFEKNWNNTELFINLIHEKKRNPNAIRLVKIKENDEFNEFMLPF